MTVLVVLVALELTLRWWPTLLGNSFANGALSRYTTRVGGIYYPDRQLRMVFMIPNHTATMFANGFVWHHETDALGFRNRPLHIPADVILLGDSVVYGHGVEFEHTLGYQLEQKSGLRVANLGRQGDCAFQEAYLLTEYLPVFKPRYVVHVFTPNDIRDLYGYLSDEAMARFIAQPVERITYPPRTVPERALRDRDHKIRQRSLGKRAEEELYLMKLGRWLQHMYRERRASALVGVAEAVPAHQRRLDSSDVATDPASLGWRYTEHAIAYMKYRAAGGGARLLMTSIASGRQLEILRGIARAHGIDYIETTDLGPDSFLPNDGHLPPKGARLMAELIARHIEQRPTTAAR